MEKYCCILGHRKIDYTKELEQRIYKAAERLIIEYDVSTFLFGSRSEFDDLCYKVITTLKNIYPHIQRIYVRAEFPYIDEGYLDNYAVKTGKTIINLL